MPDGDILDDVLVEMREHIGAIEPLLIATEHTTPRPAEIDVLFRAFHSIKGLARVVDARELETILHAAEAYLSNVRSGASRLDAPGIEALIAVLDLLQSAISARDLDNVQAQPALLTALTSLDPVHAMEPGPAAGDLVDALGLEPQMSAAFRELLQEILPSLDVTGSARIRQEWADDATVLHHAALRLGLRGLAYRAASLFDGDSEVRLKALAAIRRMGQVFEDLTGQSPAVWLDTGRDEPDKPVPERQGDRAALQAYFAKMKVAPAHLAAAPAEIAWRLLENEEARLCEAALKLDGHTTVERIANWPIVASQSFTSRDDTFLALLLVVVPGEWTELTLTAPEYPDLSHNQLLDGQIVPRYFALPSPSVENAGLPEVAPEVAQVRVPVDVLDKLFGRIGSFFSVGSRLNVLATESQTRDALQRLSDHAITQAPQLIADVEALQAERRDFLSIETEVRHLISLIHESTLGLRVIPFESIVSRFPRMVRETARALKKSARFSISANGIKIDKGMADMLVDPLMHMIRNALDHGIENTSDRVASGKPAVASITLTAEQSGNRLKLSVADDGCGIDVERVRQRAVTMNLVSAEDIVQMTDAQATRFIFAPGFSTRGQASEVSGRGVGMDVVLVNVTRLGGRIDIDTAKDRGTTIRLDMPLSAAIRHMLLVDTGIQTLGFPETMVSETAVVPRSELQHVNGQPAVLFHGRFLPIFDVCELLHLPQRAGRTCGDMAIIICRWDGRTAGFLVPRIMRRAELLIRETHLRVSDLPGIGGVSVLGADRIVLVLDPQKLMALAETSSTRGLRRAAPPLGPVLGDMHVTATPGVSS